MKHGSLATRRPDVRLALGAVVWRPFTHDQSQPGFPIDGQYIRSRWRRLLRELSVYGYRPQAARGQLWFVHLLFPLCSVTRVLIDATTPRHHHQPIRQQALRRRVFRRTHAAKTDRPEPARHRTNQVVSTPSKAASEPPTLLPDSSQRRHLLRRRRHPRGRGGCR